MAMALTLISGGIDLSIGSMIGLSTVIMCRLIMDGTAVPLAILIGAVVPVGCGFLNGVIVAKSKCVPLIVTLGMGYVYYGFALVISGGLFMSMQGQFRTLGRGVIAGIPIPMYVVILMVLGTHVLLKYSKFGRRLVALGGNETVAFLSGIGVDRLKIITYTLGGAIMALASLVLVSRLGNVLANVGEGYELRALAAAIIGGVTFEGGRGNIPGVFLGVGLLGIVQNGLNILQVSSYFQTLALGVIIVAAVVVSNIEKIRQ